MHISVYRRIKLLIHIRSVDIWLTRNEDYLYIIKLKSNLVSTNYVVQSCGGS